MSYGVHAYAIDLAALKKSIGCGDAVLAKRLSKKFASDLKSTDEIDFDDGLTSAADCLRTLIVDGAPEESDDEETPGYKFGYSLEILCRALGEWLPNSAFSGMGSEYFDTLDAALKKAKSKRRVAAVVFRGSPIPIPEIEDFPAIGWLSPEEVVAWRSELAALLGGPLPAPRKSARGAKPAKEETFSGRVEGKKLVVSAAGRKTVTAFPTNKAAQKALIIALRESNSGGAKPATSSIDPDAVDGLRELLGWLEATAAKKLGLVTFYY